MEYLSGPTVDKVVERHLTGKKGGKKGTNIDSMKKKKLGRGETSFYSLCKGKLIIHEIHSFTTLLCARKPLVRETNYADQRTKIILVQQQPRRELS